ncbi:TlpA family protein disulfide reductase (plasmid) [Paenibacillus thiaminolyticus]|uniref:TlpA family protein disulfide reductase n=1 Tax=Paenibacillus thiaminolyticus TaxID=49283 RepID=UPI00232CA4E8|nr:TlpA disulfide reductase family protein [Paenibacillus thiaminolyticus]WCF11729.1 TlpA family protein disulfide reductase [Paenibacillus thiaminolyticus]
MFKLKTSLYFLIGVLLLSGCSMSENKADVAREPIQSATTSIETSIKEKTGLKLDLEKLYPNEEHRKYAAKMIGTEAPNFKLDNLSGETIDLIDFKGQNIVLELGQTECSACQMIQPEMDKFRKANSDVTVIQVFPNDSKSAVDSFLKKTGTDIHSNILTGEAGNTVFREYKADWTPTTLFINKDGIIVFVHIGSTNQDYLEQVKKLAF